MGNLSPLLSAYRRHPAVLQILQSLDIQDGLAKINLKGLVGAQESFVLAALADASNSAKPGTTAPRCHLFVANSKEEAAYRHNDLEGILANQAVFFFPDSFKRPSFFDDLNPTQMLQRSEVVSKISPPNAAAKDSQLPSTGVVGAVIVTYPEALFEKVVKPEVLNESRIEIEKGEKLDVDFVIQVLVEYGFVRADFVYEPGQFSIRGGIIDLFSFGNEFPYRIELFDDEVETIRTFDPVTQLSQKNLSALSIVPNLSTRFKQDQKVSLFRILPPNTVVWMKDYQFMIDRLQYCFERAEQFAGKLTALDSAELREIFRDRAFLYPGEVVDDLAEKPMILLNGQN